MNMDIKNTSVYVKTNADGFVTDIDSSVFIRDTLNWIKIDEGKGDRFVHAQRNYFSKPIYDEYGRYNFRLTNDEVIEILEEDKPLVPVPEPAPPTNAELAAAIAELAEVMCGG